MTAFVYSERIRLRLGHIVENAAQIEEYIGTRDYPAFIRERIVVDACERCLARITEAAIRIGDTAMIEIAPDVPMHVFRSFGNALRHDYDRIDLATIWATIKDDLPSLRVACERALAAAAD